MSDFKTIYIINTVGCCVWSVGSRTIRERSSEGGRHENTKSQNNIINCSQSSTMMKTPPRSRVGPLVLKEHGQYTTSTAAFLPKVSRDSAQFCALFSKALPHTPRRNSTGPSTRPVQHAVRLQIVAATDPTVIVMKERKSPICRYSPNPYALLGSI
jgi:hypothetical protein